MLIGSNGRLNPLDSVKDLMLFKKIPSVSLALITSVTLIVTMSVPANATPVLGTSEQVAESTNGQSATNNLAKKFESLKNGESLTYSSPTGENFKVTNSNGQLTFTRISNSSIATPASSWCATSLAAVVFGIGATALAAAAVATGGGTVVIGGVALSGAQLGGLAAVAGSFSALEAYIDSKIC